MSDRPSGWHISVEGRVRVQRRAFATERARVRDTRSADRSNHHELSKALSGVWYETCLVIVFMAIFPKLGGKSAAREAKAMCGLGAAALLIVLGGCGYNEVIERDEDVKGAWGEVQNQYKRRADLVPSLVKVVQGAAKFEQETLKQVVEARASVAGVKVDASTIEDPAKLAQFEAAQAKLSGALSRLLVVAENYPDLKASAAFRNLQAQLEGTENRIAVARNRYIEAVQAYNTTVRRFPNNVTAMIFDYDVKPTFTVENEAEIARPPQVRFGQ